MDNVIQYTTQDGDRWDLIAEDQYGSPNMMNQIIMANADVPRYDILPGGIVLDIPILDSTDVALDADSLPPWKR